MKQKYKFLVVFGTFAFFFMLWCGQARIASASNEGSFASVTVTPITFDQGTVTSIRILGVVTGFSMDSAYCGVSSYGDAFYNALPVVLFVNSVSVGNFGTFDLGPDEFNEVQTGVDGGCVFGGSPYRNYEYRINKTINVTGISSGDYQLNFSGHQSPCGPYTDPGPCNFGASPGHLRVRVTTPSCLLQASIGVTSNIPSSWTVSGPNNYSGSGTSGSYNNVPDDADYTIANIPPTLTYSGVDYSLSSISPGGTQHVGCGSNIGFSITYSPVGGGPPPGGSTGTIVVNTNRSESCFQVYKGNSGQNPYGSGQCGTTYTYTNVPAPDTYQLTANVVAGITPGVTPNVWQTLLAGRTVVFNVYYGSAGTPPPTPVPTGTVAVAATLNGAPVNAALVANYTYGGTTGAPASTVSNYAVPAPSAATAYVGNYVVTYVSGGPAGSTFQSITPSGSQTLAANGTVAFTFNFTNGSPSYGMDFNALYTRRPLNAPAITSLVNSTCGQVTVNWSYVDNGVGQWFTVWRSANPTLGYSQVGGVPAGANVGIAARSWADSAVAANTSYYYRVQSHTVLAGGIGDTMVASSAESGPVLAQECSANMFFTKTLTHVNGAPYNPSVTVRDGDVLRFLLLLNNLGPSDASINYICLSSTANLTGFANLTATSGANGGITGAGGSCVTRRLNVSGTQTEADPNWVVTYEATVAAAANTPQELLNSTATLHYTDPSGPHARSATFGALLIIQSNNSRVPDFREVGPT